MSTRWLRKITRQRLPIARRILCYKNVWLSECCNNPSDKIQLELYPFAADNIQTRPHDVTSLWRQLPLLMHFLVCCSTVEHRAQFPFIRVLFHVRCPKSVRTRADRVHRKSQIADFASSLPMRKITPPATTSEPTPFIPLSPGRLAAVKTVQDTRLNMGSRRHMLYVKYKNTKDIVCAKPRTNHSPSSHRNSCGCRKRR
jgi:hypothetical protein